MSEISVEDEIDCSTFVQNIEEPKKNFISEKSIEFVHIVKNKGSDVLNVKAGPSGRKEVSSETSSVQQETPVRKEKPKANIHNSAEELIAKKIMLNSRYRKNLKERKCFWKNKNSDQNFINSERVYNQNTNSSPLPKSQSKPFLKPHISTPQISKSKGSKPIENPKTSFSPKNQSSKPNIMSKDVKVKGKVISEPEITLEEYNANLKKEENAFLKNMAKSHKEFIPRKTIPIEINLCDHKVEVFKIEKGKNYVMRDEQYYSEWYIDNGCFRHMTGRREELREFRSLSDGGKLKFGNNATSEIKGYRMITNDEFAIWKVACVEGLQHNLISVLYLVVDTRLKLLFDDESSEIIEKKTKAVLLKSKRKAEMYPLNLNPINGKPSIYLLTKASSDDTWLWHRTLSHQNFKDINKLVIGDLVHGLPLLKFEKEHL
ncbi:uncharacterized protein LOC111915392 [Lactuca sativa]|uniref:uncharacterized protein LOC111915392 n=1 Tax=Lactuca sativa TaxID=4236 RepID=UPI000CD953B8|nr:uncharacterized protein LOC111915392 [Lactuca sativa]